jgi:hypothetical protein
MLVKHAIERQLETLVEESNRESGFVSELQIEHGKQGFSQRAILYRRFPFVATYFRASVPAFAWGNLYSSLSVHIIDHRFVIIQHPCIFIVRPVRTTAQQPLTHTTPLPAPPHHTKNLHTPTIPTTSSLPKHSKYVPTSNH